MESLPTPATPSLRQPLLRDQFGASLLHLVIILSLVGALAATTASLTSHTSQTLLCDFREKRAYYLALSGLNAWSSGMTGTFTLPEGSFTLTQVGPDADGYYTVTSKGQVLAGSAFEANALLAAKRSAANPITFDHDLSGFPEPVVGKTENSAKAITVYAASADLLETTGMAKDTDTTKPVAGSGLLLGGTAANTSGAIWYTGSHGTCASGTCPSGACLSGRCRFGKGLRAYFQFRFADVDTSDKSTAYGDGFTFAVINAQGNNPGTAAGGPRSGSRAEYLGYAGLGPSGCGIAAPKMAVEVDTYPNKNAYPPELADSRRDQSDANHIAAVYWGCGDTLFDDNVHGAGTAPQNPVADATNSHGYHAVAKQTGRPNWLEDGAEHSMRLEIHRTDCPSGGAYTLKVWIDGTGCAIDDVSADYSATSPDLETVATLSATDHAQLDTIYFGWTEATGTAKQSVFIHDFSLDFRR